MTHPGTSFLPPGLGTGCSLCLEYPSQSGRAAPLGLKGCLSGATPWAPVLGLPGGQSQHGPPPGAPALLACCLVDVVTAASTPNDRCVTLTRMSGVHCSLPCGDPISSPSLTRLLPSFLQKSKLIRGGLKPHHTDAVVRQDRTFQGPRGPLPGVEGTGWTSPRTELVPPCPDPPILQVRKLRLDIREPARSLGSAGSVSPTAQALCFHQDPQISMPHATQRSTTPVLGVAPAQLLAHRTRKWHKRPLYKNGKVGHAHV